MALGFNIGYPLSAVLKGGAGLETVYQGYEMHYFLDRYCFGGTYSSLYLLSSTDSGFAFYVGRRWAYGI